MNSAICSSCGLVNLLTDPSCRRCGKPFGSRRIPPDRLPSTMEAAKRGFPFFSTLIVIAVIAFAVYLYRSVQQEMGRIQPAEANRNATQPDQEPAGLSRTEYDGRRAGKYGNAMQHNPGIATAESRTRETEKLMAPAANAQR